MSDYIFVRDLYIEMIIGLLPHERETPQPVVLNINVFTSTRTAGGDDDLSSSIDYAALTAEIQAWCRAHQPLTVETLAEDLATLCLANPNAREVHIDVEKPNAIEAARSVGVHIERKR